MEGERKLDELDAALSTLSYPVSKDRVLDELGGVTLLYADGEEALADVVGRIQSDSFGSRDELQMEIFNQLPTRAVGEPGQSEGEG